MRKEPLLPHLPSGEGLEVVLGGGDLIVGGGDLIGGGVGDIVVVV